MSEIKVVKNWDSMPPVLQSGHESFSTRVLERNYRKMEEALEAILNQGLDARQCRELAASTLAEVRK